MPYIRPERRKRFANIIAELDQTLEEPGDLNYVISCALNSATAGAGRNYHTMSRWRAAVTDASQEFYRRVMGPAEDAAIKRNGDVYDA